MTSYFNGYLHKLFYKYINYETKYRKTLYGSAYYKDQSYPR